MSTITRPHAFVTGASSGIGAAFAERLAKDGYEGVAWDVYYLYGPDAVWETIPSPLVGSGGTIIREREKLEIEVSTLMKK